MHTPLSDEEKEKIRERFRISYQTRVTSGTGDSTPVSIRLHFTKDPGKTPVEIFQMRTTARYQSASCFVYDFEEVEHENYDSSKATAIRKFLLDSVIKSMMEHLKEDDFKYIFIYSAIPHIPEVFMDHKFKIRMTEKINQAPRFVGYRKL